MDGGLAGPSVREVRLTGSFFSSLLRRCTMRRYDFPPKQGQRQLREHTIQRSTLTRSGRLLAANMLGDLLSKAAGHGGTAAELEAMTAERDFFREKYTEQMMKMSAMEEILSDNQRIIHKLRGEILAAKKQHQQCQQQNSNEGATTMTASNANVITDDEVSPKHDDTTHDDKDNESHSETSASSTNRDNNNNSSDNEAEEIRANAERMLQWAQYQSTKKSSSSEQSLMRQQQNSSCRDDMKVVISAKSLVDLDSDQDRDTSVTIEEGKMSKLFDNLRDIISPSLSSDDEDEECESDDESSSCERSNDK